MTGLEKIIEKIGSDSASKCSSIIEAAEKECAKIIAQAEENGKNYEEAVVKEANAACEKIIAMAKSGAAQQTRQILLSARVDAINETLDSLMKALKTLPDDVYFNTVIKLASENAAKGKCVVKLNANDKSRMPADFAEKLVSALAVKGAQAVISDETVDIASGVILDYGDIVVDCSFEAITDDRKDDLKAEISSIIF